MRSILALSCVALAAGCPLAPPQETVYFVVSELDVVHGDSYILPLRNPADIAHARALIADPENTDGHIVVARIGRGAGDPPNRNVTGDGEPWSWRVTQFEQFADMTIEILDGWPTYVEENLDEWIMMTGGRIGFWSYTVTEELELLVE
jgi:hypothetical protein